MKQLESGLYYLSPREIKKLAAAAEHYERTFGKEIDITQPLKLEEALFLKVSEAALAGERKVIEACLEVLDDAIARSSRPN